MIVGGTRVESTRDRDGEAMISESTQEDVISAERAAQPAGTTPWVSLVSATERMVPDPPLHSRRVYAQVIAVTAAVVIAVGVLGSYASQRMAEAEGIRDAQQRSDTLADAVVQPALEDGIINLDKKATQKLDEAVRAHMLSKTIKRVKFWTPDGLIVYSDEPGLIGDRFPLGEDEKAVLASAVTRAEVSNLKAKENRFEANQGKLLEVYRRVYTPGGHVLLFETYSPYSVVSERTSEIWRGFAGITFSSLLILVVLLLPLLWRLLDRLSRFQSQREALLERAVEASSEERRRIAATLHDGVVQELAATSFVVSGAALRAESAGQTALAQSLTTAADTVRTSIGGLRSLLVDIYPPSLNATGLATALGDLVASLRTRNIDVRLTLPDGPTGLGKDGERLVFRIAQECLRNAARHAQADTVLLELRSVGNKVVLDVIDDGIGFDAEAAVTRPAEGHFGLRLMADATAQAHGQLRVRSAPGEGTHWQLRVPTP
ncbi:MAG: hypothetical protein JWN06_1975 [Propionibacteriaceae bacterium]|jgi:two-component system NarL family sensor kinase|nr:hypothetical protein [Propionibacteriaceae bacterium]